jgi:FKBP-type peptidyl-prolyl cis-trans isomerase FklB
MRSGIIIGGVALAGATLMYAVSTGRAPAQPAGEAEQGEVDQNDALAYGVGYFLGGEVRNGLSEDGVEANLERVAQGFIDGLQAREAAYDPETLDAILEAVHEEMQARRVARLMETDAGFKALAERNAARSEAFVNANGQREGVATLFEGVQYEVLSAGSGSAAAEATEVVLSFEASTVEGDPFLAGTHAPIDLGEVRPTARAIVQRMRTGDHWRVVIAPESAFGLAGLPPDVGPNEAIVIDVTLEEVR